MNGLRKGIKKDMTVKEALEIAEKQIREEQWQKTWDWCSNYFDNCLLPKRSNNK